MSVKELFVLSPNGNLSTSFVQMDTPFYKRIFNIRQDDG
jgi:hypothetical protein